MKLVIEDGGRAASGHRSHTGDCVCRAIATVSGRPYQEIYDALNRLAANERRGKRKRGISSARSGVYKATYQRLISQMFPEAVWTPTMTIGSGCTVHLRADELPKGRLLVSLSKHLTAVIDGVVHDTHDPSRNGTRCVYGFWIFPS